MVAEISNFGISREVPSNAATTSFKSKLSADVLHVCTIITLGGKGVQIFKNGLKPPLFHMFKLNLFLWVQISQLIAVPFVCGLYLKLRQDTCFRIGTHNVCSFKTLKDLHA